jgi:hypothetical protein
MSTTPNYNWPLIEPTDFVTNLPADLETLADAIDATVDGIDNRVTDLEVITTEGDLIIGDASGDPVALPIGAAGAVLTSDGDTASWAAATSGGMTLIATATPNAASSVSFTSIPTTFKTLLLVADSVFQSAATGNWGVRLNNDTATNYNWNGLRVSATTFSVDINDGTYFNGGAIGGFIPDSTDDGTFTLGLTSANFWIFNADQTTGRKKVSWQSRSNPSGGNRGAVVFEGLYRGTSAISQIDLIRSSTQTISGTIRLYGVS